MTSYGDKPFPKSKWNGGRSLKFVVVSGGGPYDFHVEVKGAVSGVHFGTLLMMKQDAEELVDQLRIALGGGANA